MAYNERKVCLVDNLLNKAVDGGKQKGKVESSDIPECYELEEERETGLGTKGGRRNGIRRTRGKKTP